MSSTPFVGIVTVLFNSDDVLQDFFDSLSTQQEVSYRLYVIDNSPLDSGSEVSRKLAQQCGIDTVVVFNNENVGVAKGNNQGIELALHDGCEFVLLSNNDIVFDDPKLISNMLTFADQQSADAVAPKIYYFGEQPRIWCAGGKFSMMKGTTPHFGDGELDCGQYDQMKKIDYAPTCFMLMRGALFNEIGMMDERYFVYYDDSDYLLRMKRSGKSLFYWPNGIVWHKVSYSTGGNEGPFGIFYGSRNRLFFIKKNFTSANKAASLLFFFATRIFKWISYSESQRKALRDGIRHGISMKP